MGSAFAEAPTVLTEPVPVSDTFVTGLGFVEANADFVRLNFVSERILVDGALPPTATETAITARIVCTPERLRRIIRQLQVALEPPGAH